MSLDKSRSTWDSEFIDGSVVERVGEFDELVEIKMKNPFTIQNFRLKRSWIRDRDGGFTIALANVVDANSSTGEPEGLFAGWKVSRYTPSRMHDGSALPGSPRTLARPCCLVTEVSRIYPCGRQKIKFGKMADLEEELLVSRLSALKQFCEYTMDMEANRTRSAVDITAAEMVAHEHGDSATNKGYRCYAPSSGCAFNLCDSQDKNSVQEGSLGKGKWPFEAGIKSTNCWCSPDGDGFRVRGLNYLHDGKKVPAGQPLAKLFAVDWFVDYKRMDDVCSRPAGTCQRYLLGTKRGSNTSFVFAVNIQVPGARHFSIIYYYVLAAPVDADSLLGRFIHGNDHFRNSRLKLIPRVALGPWVVQRAVGTKPLIVGRALKVTYHSSQHYMEVDIDIGSSTVANNIVRFVLGYVRTLVVDMCFLIEGKRVDELPVRVLHPLNRYITNDFISRND
uniref:Protein ENHANCED DISEASE RESISTANCE 2 C-terminal domain-containing protein n=2 Tax=Micromonas pusilla TaxID=38833 RepID=A0A7S0KE79_MICPS|mmetsp:Transcript_12194/g.47405  ORF Transcript_12194/g.47405 Transcript_12194/m.47405 type:complete len:448 (+) Transcript_12194:339-1682(+)